MLLFLPARSLFQLLLLALLLKLDHSLEEASHRASFSAFSFSRSYIFFFFFMKIVRPVMLMILFLLQLDVWRIFDLASSGTFLLNLCQCFFFFFLLKLFTGRYTFLRSVTSIHPFKCNSVALFNSDSLRFPMSYSFKFDSLNNLKPLTV